MRADRVSAVLATLWVLAMSAPLEARADSAQVLTFLEVRTDAAASAGTLLRRYAQRLRGDEPSLTARVLRQMDRPEHFLLLEASDRPELLLDRERQARPILQSVTILLTAPPDRRTHRSFVSACPSGVADAAPSAQPEKKSSGREAIYVIAHLDIAGPVSEAPRAALERLAGAACRAAGNESFDVWQQLDRGNHFNLIARWSRRRAFSLSLIHI